MAALTDLTWQQLAAKLPAGAITLVPQDESVPAKVIIDVNLVADTNVDALTDTGVVKFFSMLFTAANRAQIDANVDQIDGERLTAFSPATIGNSANGFVTLTRPFVCRSELSTATNIIGTSG